MEVPGKLAGGASKSFTPEDQLCTPCQLDNRQEKVEGYCDVCKEYLCATCVDCHRRFRVSKGHMILTGSAIPAANLDNPEPDTACTEVCAKHKDKFIEYICHDHNIFGCMVCITTGHRSCKIDYIPDLAKTFKESLEYKTLLSDMEQTDKLFAEIDRRFKDKHQRNLSLQQTALKDIQNLKTKVIKQLDMEERALLENARQHMEQNEQSILNAKESKTRLFKKWTCLQHEFYQQEGQHSQLYVSAKRVMNHIASFKSECGDIFASIHIQEYEFMPSESLQKMTNNNWVMGEITNSPVTLSEKTDFKFDGKLDVKHNSDTLWHQYICGMTMVGPDRLLLADHLNESVKLVDTQSQKIVSCVKLSHRPVDLASLGDNSVAVTLPSVNKIKILSVGDEVHELRAIEVKDNCAGISYTNGNLIVTYSHSKKLEVLCLYCTADKILDIGRQGLSIGSDPRIAVRYRGAEKNLYLANGSNNTITKVSMTGEMVCQLTDKNLESPRDLTVVENDYLAVCGKDKIFLISDKDQQLKIEKQFNCVAFPIAITFNPKRKVLYVSSDEWRDRQSIQCYNII